MKKIFVAAVVAAAVMAGPMAFANPNIMKKHSGKNCTYCHDEAKVEKKKGQDCKKLQEGPKCSTCHAKMPKDCPK